MAMVLIYKNNLSMAAQKRNCLDVNDGLESVHQYLATPDKTAHLCPPLLKKKCLNVRKAVLDDDNNNDDARMNNEHKT